MKQLDASGWLGKGKIIFIKMEKKKKSTLFYEAFLLIFFSGYIVSKLYTILTCCLIWFSRTYTPISKPWLLGSFLTRRAGILFLKYFSLFCHFWIYCSLKSKMLFLLLISQASAAVSSPKWGDSSNNSIWISYTYNTVIDSLVANIIIRVS